MLMYQKKSYLRSSFQHYALDRYDVNSWLLAKAPILYARALVRKRFGLLISIF